MRGRSLHATLLAAVLAAAASSAAYAANVSVDRLELLSHGSADASGLYQVDSRLYFGLSLEGGDKFAGLLRLDFLSGQVERDLGLLQDSLPPTATLSDAIDRLNAAGLRLRTVAVSARRLFGRPLEATYFVGELDTFCSGDDFTTLFGAAPFATALRGPMVYPDGIGGDPNRYYDGIHAVYGTGARLGAGLERAAAYLYLYQDSDLGQGRWSADLRGLLDADKLKLELFAGASYDPSSAFGYYRAGMLFHYAPGAVGEFYAQVGAPRMDPAAGVGIDDFFFLFEPRVNFAPGSLAITVFYHPAYYRQKATGEEGALDLGMNLKFGDVSRTGSQGGLESLLAFRPVDAEPLSVDIAPYFSAIASGLEWSFKLNLGVFPFPADWYAVLEPFVGVKTSF